MAALKVGDLARVTETYSVDTPGEYSVTYEGPVCGVDDSCYRIGAEAGPCTLAWREDNAREGVAVTAVRLEPRLPNVTGAIVRGIDRETEETLTCERSQSGYWYAVGRDRSHGVPMDRVIQRVVLHVPTDLERL